MTKVRFTIECDFDEVESSSHAVRNEEGNEQYPLVADPSQWTYDDFTGAYDEEIITLVEIVNVEVLA